MKVRRTKTEQGNYLRRLNDHDLRDILLGLAREFGRRKKRMIIVGPFATDEELCAALTKMIESMRAQRPSETRH